MSRDKRAIEVADTLGINYRRALGYVRTVGSEYDGPELVHACRNLKEEEEKSRAAFAGFEAEKRMPKRRKYGVLPKGAGRVNCTHCDATAAADGEGSPIVLKHDDGCPEKYSIKDHAYDAGNPRDDSKGCIASLWTSDGTEEWYEPCGQSLGAHAHSEYPEDGR